MNDQHLENLVKKVVAVLDTRGEDWNLSISKDIVGHEILKFGKSNLSVSAVTEGKILIEDKLGCDRATVDVTEQDHTHLYSLLVKSFYNTVRLLRDIEQAERNKFYDDWAKQTGQKLPNTKR